jgi:Leucine-rich repeat (LRR) protein
MNALEVINLRNTQLQSISRKLFLNLINLKEINLSQNNLKKLHQDTFSGKKTLNFILC